MSREQIAGLSGRRPMFDFKEPPPREGRFSCICFATDRETGKVITILTNCSLTWCQECISEWWFAI